VGQNYWFTKRGIDESDLRVYTFGWTTVSGGLGLMSAYQRGKRRVLVSFAYAIAVTALFALIGPAVLVAGVIAYARFVIHKSVDIEWHVLGILDDPLGWVACGVVFVSVFVWRLRR